MDSEQPDHGILGGRRERPVPVFQRRVRLTPRQRGFLELESRFPRQPDGPAAAEEDVMRPVDQPVIQVGGHRSPRLLHDRAEIVPDVRSRHGQDGRGEPGLHHGLLVSVIKHQQLIRGLADRRGSISGDPDLASRAVRIPQRVKDLDGCSRAGHREQRVVVAKRQLRRWECIGLSMASGLARGGDRARYMPGRATADDRDPFASGRKYPGGLADRLERPNPAVWLTCNIPLHVRLRSTHRRVPSKTRTSCP